MQAWADFLAHANMHIGDADASSPPFGMRVARHASDMSGHSDESDDALATAITRSLQDPQAVLTGEDALRAHTPSSSSSPSSAENDMSTNYDIYDSVIYKCGRCNKSYTQIQLWCMFHNGDPYCTNCGDDELCVMRDVFRVVQAHAIWNFALQRSSHVPSNMEELSTNVEEAGRVDIEQLHPALAPQTSEHRRAKSVRIRSSSSLRLLHDDTEESVIDTAACSNGDEDKMSHTPTPVLTEEEHHTPPLPECAVSLCDGKCRLIRCCNNHYIHADCLFYHILRSKVETCPLCRDKYLMLFFYRLDCQRLHLPIYFAKSPYNGLNAVEYLNSMMFNATMPTDDE